MNSLRRIASITGTRADYGLMQPVHRAIAAAPGLELHLLVTGMHFLPEFASGLAQVRDDQYGVMHELPILTEDDSAKAMADALGRGVQGLAAAFDRIEPDILLLQGDRGEMLAGAIAAAHMNIPIVHMSGGDISGSIDDSIRNAISKFAHLHLTNCAASTERLLNMGEAAERILEVGEPGLDQLLQTDFLPLEQLQAQLGLPPGEAFLVATLHPVTDEAAAAARQMEIVLLALERLEMPVVFTHPNSDAGGRAMRDVLEAWRGKDFLHVVQNLGSQRYLSLVRHAAAVVGNSSSGIYDTPTLKVPAVNIGSRQTGRMRAGNVIDVDFDLEQIVQAVRQVMHDPGFRGTLAACRNPFGDGRAAERTVDVLRRLRLGPALAAKWRFPPEPLFAPDVDDL